VSTQIGLHVIKGNLSKMERHLRDAIIQNGNVIQNFHKRNFRETIEKPQIEILTESIHPICELAIQELCESIKNMKKVFIGSPIKDYAMFRSTCDRLTYSEITYLNNSLFLQIKDPDTVLPKSMFLSTHLIQDDMVAVIKFTCGEKEKMDKNNAIFSNEVRSVCNNFRNVFYACTVVPEIIPLVPLEFRPDEDYKPKLLKSEPTRDVFHNLKFISKHIAIASLDGLKL
jgi:hypothetical protein